MSFRKTSIDELVQMKKEASDIKKELQNKVLDEKIGSDAEAAKLEKQYEPLVSMLGYKSNEVGGLDDTISKDGKKIIRIGDMINNILQNLNVVSSNTMTRNPDYVNDIITPNESPTISISELASRSLQDLRMISMDTTGIVGDTTQINNTITNLNNEILKGKLDTESIGIDLGRLIDTFFIRAPINENVIEGIEKGIDGWVDRYSPLDRKIIMNATREYLSDKIGKPMKIEYVDNIIRSLSPSDARTLQLLKDVHTAISRNNQPQLIGQAQIGQMGQVVSPPPKRRGRPPKNPDEPAPRRRRSVELGPTGPMKEVFIEKKSAERRKSIESASNKLIEPIKPKKENNTTPSGKKTIRDTGRRRVDRSAIAQAQANKKGFGMLPSIGKRTRFGNIDQLGYLGDNIWINPERLSYGVLNVHKIKGAGRKQSKITIKFGLPVNVSDRPILTDNVDQDFIDLIKKRYNKKKAYSPRSIEIFKRVASLGGLNTIDDNSKGQKKSIISPGGYHGVSDELSGKIVKIITDPNELIERLALLSGTIESGNESPTIKSELGEIADILLGKKMITNDAHRKIYDKYIVHTLE